MRTQIYFCMTEISEFESGVLKSQSILNYTALDTEDPAISSWTHLQANSG